MQTEEELIEALEQERREDKKRDGFKGEKMVVLPTETFSDYVKHPLVKRLYLTDVGFFPKAAHHYRERREGIEEYIFIYCTEGKGIIYVEGRKYVLKTDEAFCIPRFRSHCYYACDDDPWSILWVHLKGEDIKYYPVEDCKIVKLHRYTQQTECCFFLNSCSGFWKAASRLETLFIFPRCLLLFWLKLMIGKNAMLQSNKINMLRM